MKDNGVEVSCVYLVLIDQLIRRIHQLDTTYRPFYSEQRAAGEWFKKDCIGSVTTWEDLVEKFVQKFYQLFYDNEEIEAEEDDDPDNIDDIFKIKGRIRTYEEYELNNTVTRDLEEPWLDNGDHKWYDELADGKMKEETLMHKEKVEESWGYTTPNLQECWWKMNAHEVTPFTYLESYGERPYANFKTEKAHDPYLKINRIFGRNYDTSNTCNTQDNQGHEERRDDPTHEPSVCKIKRFEMMKYSFNADEEYIAIKEFEYLNHLKDNLNAYQEILRIIEDGWLIATPDDE
ncbi:hypothetical protein Tco_1341854 [Tanacetum coccineum]